MIAWTIEAAISSNVFDCVVVSTDAPEIAEVARSYGASVPFLRDNAYDDMCPVSDATIHTLKQLEQDDGRSFKVVTQLMATCPLRTANDIQDAAETFQNSNANFLISYFQPPFTNPWWATSIDSDWHPTPRYPNEMKKRSQDLPQVYFPTGAIWMAKTSCLLDAGTFYGQGLRATLLHSTSGIDIDTPEDLALAEKMLSTLPSQKNEE